MSYSNKLLARGLSGKADCISDVSYCGVLHSRSWNPCHRSQAYCDQHEIYAHSHRLAAQLTGSRGTLVLLISDLAVFGQCSVSSGV